MYMYMYLNMYMYMYAYIVYLYVPFSTILAGDLSRLIVERLVFLDE